MSQVGARLIVASMANRRRPRLPVLAGPSARTLAMKSDTAEVEADGFADGVLGDADEAGARPCAVPDAGLATSGFASFGLVSRANLGSGSADHVTLTWRGTAAAAMAAS